MNTLLLILLCAFEAAFAFLAISRKADIKSWKLGRLICNAGQLAVFLVMLIAPGVDLSFRFMGLFVLLLIRIAVAGIGVLIKGKKSGSKRTVFIITSALLSAALFLLFLVPSYVITDYDGLPVSGKYSVAQANAILVDNSRTEEFETDGTNREVPVYFYYPENADNESFPLVVFSHGAFGYNMSNYSTYTELASNGYVVISAEHPYHSLFTLDTSGNTIIVDPSLMNGIMEVNSDGVSEERIFELSSDWLRLRTDDLNFVIDSVKSAAGENALAEFWHTDSSEDILRALSITDTEKIGVMGHSLGGAAAVELGRTRSDISAVIDLDGTMLGAVTGVENERNIINDQPYTTPLLSFDNEEHHFAAIEAREQDIPYANNIVHDNAVCAYRTYIPNSGHMNFTDLPMYSPVLAGMLGTGSVDAEACMQTINSITLRFFNSFLKEGGEFIVQECTDIS